MLTCVERQLQLHQEPSRGQLHQRSQQDSALKFTVADMSMVPFSLEPVQALLLSGILQNWRRSFGALDRVL